MDKISYRLENFEGPLDLLLMLITKNKVNIYDIPILDITDQYLEIINNQENANLEYTGEFIVMAAQLLFIKSKMLIPKVQEEKETIDPREDLATRLILYKKFKEASQELRKRENATRNMMFKESEKISFPIPPYDKSHDLTDLLDAFDTILARRRQQVKPDKAAFYGIVGREKVSVEDMVDKIYRRLNDKDNISFSSLFGETESKPELIATFLAVLEMIKLARIVANKDEEQGDIIIIRTDVA